MPKQSWKLSVAPMIDVTDKHCRFFHRLHISGARPNTEKIAIGVLTHVEIERHMDFSEQEYPVAL